MKIGENRIAVLIGREGEVKKDHNVNGRDIYGLGALDGVTFLQRKREAGEKGKVYSMIDVLKGE